MNIAIVLAHVLGITFAVLGVSMIFNRKWTATVLEDMTKNQGLLWLAGFITLFMGAIVVSLDTTWISRLYVIVGIIGWLMIIKGAVILIFPNAMASYYKKMNTGSIFVWGGLIALLLGLLLLWK